MQTRRRWLLLVFLASIVLGLTLVRTHGANHLAILSSSSKYRVITRDELYGKPWIDIPLGGVNRFRWPIRGITLDYQPKDMASAAGIIGYEGKAFWDETWSIEGQTLEIEGRHIFDPSPWIHAPYVFGNKSREAVLRPIAGVDPIRVRLPANGIPAPSFPALSTKVGDLTVVMTPRPVLSPLAPPVYDVQVKSNTPGEMICLRATIRGRKGDDSFFDAASLVVAPTSGALVLDSWYPTSYLRLLLTRMEEENSFVTVRRKTVGKIITVDILDSKGKLFMTHSFENGRLTGSSSGQESSYAGLEFDHESIGYRQWKGKLRIGFMGDTDTFIKDRIQGRLLAAKDGDKLPVKAFTEGKHVETEITIKCPSPRMFELH